MLHRGAWVWNLVVTNDTWILNANCDAIMVHCKCWQVSKVALGRCQIPNSSITCLIKPWGNQQCIQSSSWFMKITSHAGSHRKKGVIGAQSATYVCTCLPLTKDSFVWLSVMCAQLFCWDIHCMISECCYGLFAWERRMFSVKSSGLFNQRL